MKKHSLSLRRLSVGVLAMLAAAWLSARTVLEVPGRSHGEPGITFEQPCHDFGKVPDGDRLRHTFRWTNESREPVKVMRVTTTCGCLAHEEGHRSVAPGESGYITVELKTLGLNAPARLKKVASAEFGRQEQRYSVALTVSADVRPDVAVARPEVVFTPQGPDATYLSEIDIRREMLSVSGFAALRIVRLAPYYVLKGNTRGDDRMRILVGLRCAALPMYLPPLELEYKRDGASKVVYLPVRKPSNVEGVRIVPSSYLARVTSSTEQNELQRATKRTMHMLTSDRGEVLITKIVAKNPDHSFGWALPSGAGDQFELWVKRLPREKRISAATLVVSYYDAGRRRRGTVDLHTYVIATDSGQG